MLSSFSLPFPLVSGCTFIWRAEIKELPLERDYREVGDLAVWTVTSAKQGNGVEQLRDGRTDTYWQSDGLQPHLINVQFQKKARMQTPDILSLPTVKEQLPLLDCLTTFTTAYQLFTLYKSDWRECLRAYGTDVRGLSGSAPSGTRDTGGRVTMKQDLLLTRSRFPGCKDYRSDATGYSSM